MVYKYYKLSRDAAWVILSEANTPFFPLMMSKVCSYLNVDIRSYTQIENDGGGRAMCVDGYFCIFVDDSLPCEMQRFVAAHELGHIVLGHLGKDTEIPSGDKTGKSTPAEREADSFAMRLTMPLCVMWACEMQSAEETAYLFGVPLEYAKKRFKRFTSVKEREMFLVKDIERTAFLAFGGFINGYRRAKKLPPLNIYDMVKKAENRFAKEKQISAKTSTDKKTAEKPSSGETAHALAVQESMWTEAEDDLLISQESKTTKRVTPRHP